MIWLTLFLSQATESKFVSKIYQEQLIQSTKVGRRPPAFGPIHMLKYISDFMYFIYQVMAHFMKNISSSCGNTNHLIPGVGMNQGNG